MKNQLNLSVTRRGNGFLLRMRSDDLKTVSVTGGPVPVNQKEHLSFNLPGIRKEMDKFLDEYLVEPTKPKPPKSPTHK